LFVWERVEREDEEKLKETKQKTKKTGVRQLVRAKKTQRAGRLVLCIMLLAAMVLFMLLIILLRAIF
jgi:hypothetical protein